MKKRNKRAQQLFGLPFSVLFSIILIVFFIVVAGIAIRHFLNLRDCTQIGLFIEELQADVDKAWGSQSSSFESSGNLPSNIDYVCFANLSENFNGDNFDIENEIGLYQGQNANLFFYPNKNTCNMPYHYIEHLDIGKITALKNPYCIAVSGGKIKIQIEKGFNDNLVGLS